MYRLEGVTMQHLHVYQGPFRVVPRREIAMEALPIPYSLTDLARDFLMRLGVEQEAADLTANADNPDSASARVLGGNNRSRRNVQRAGSQ